MSINVQTQVGRIPAQKEKLATPKNIVDFWLIEDNIWQAETKVGEWISCVARVGAGCLIQFTYEVAEEFAIAVPVGSVHREVDSIGTKLRISKLFRECGNGVSHIGQRVSEVIDGRVTAILHRLS